MFKLIKLAAGAELVCSTEDIEYIAKQQIVPTFCMKMFNNAFIFSLHEDSFNALKEYFLSEEINDN